MQEKKIQNKQVLPNHISFTSSGQLMVSIDGKNYFHTKKKLLPTDDGLYNLFISDGKKPRIATPLEASIIEKYFPNWRTRGFGKQD